jgi:membrane protein YqaA with SNARE-associated domain
MREVTASVLRFVAGLFIAFALVSLLGYLFRSETQALARHFVARFGVWGMAFGTLLADGLHFPIPPQFYMLAAIASGRPAASALTAIVLASLVAGFIGYGVAARASRWAWLQRKTKETRRLLKAAFEKHGYSAALVASVLPIPYSFLCYAAGLNRLPLRFLSLLVLARIPKLLVFYYFVYLGWSASAH